MHPSSHMVPDFNIVINHDVPAYLPVREMVFKVNTIDVRVLRSVHSEVTLKVHVMISPRPNTQSLRMCCFNLSQSLLRCFNLFLHRWVLLPADRRVPVVAGAVDYIAV